MVIFDIKVELIFNALTLNKDLYFVAVVDSFQKIPSKYY